MDSHTEIVIFFDLTLNNGDIVYNTESLDNRPVGSTATYSCNPGYILTGESTSRVCMSGGDGVGHLQLVKVSSITCTQFAFQTIVYRHRTDCCSTHHLF